MMRRQMMSLIAAGAGIFATQSCGGARSWLPFGGGRRGAEDPPEARPFVPMVLPDGWLEQSWEAYCRKFVQPDGRVVDFQREGITTSEGQVYAMLRALWLGDEARFVHLWRWTSTNLLSGVRSDALMPWKWGRRPDGTWGVLDVHSASDADILLALCLLGAAKRFGPSAEDGAYERQARAGLSACWNILVLPDARCPVLLPGDWRVDGPVLRVNPSYQLLFAFQAFAKLDAEHAWETVRQEGLRQLTACRGSAGLSVDWCSLDPTDATYLVEGDPASVDSRFGFEALRVPWNLTCDALWRGADGPPPLLRALTAPLMRHFRVHGALPAVWRADGKPAVGYPSLALYGALLPAFQWLDPSLAKRLLERVLRPAYQAGLFLPVDDYYAQNWAWFGLALASGLPKPL